MDIALVALAWFVPLLPVIGFFLAGCPCCGECGGTSNCLPGQNQVTITVSGWTNGSLGTCNLLNGTFILNTRSDGGSSGGCCSLGSEITTERYQYQACVKFTAGVGHSIVVTCRALGGFSGGVWTWSPFAVDATLTSIDCSAIGGPHTVPFLSHTGGATCNHDGSSVTATLA